MPKIQKRILEEKYLKRQYQNLKDRAHKAMGLDLIHPFVKNLKTLPIKQTV